MKQGPVKRMTEKTRDGYRVTESQTDYYGPFFSFSIPYIYICVLIGIAAFLLFKQNDNKKEQPLKLKYCNESEAGYSLPQGCRKIYFSEAAASSEKLVILDRYTYGPAKAIDEDMESSWQEGDSGDGKNEWLKLSFKDSEKIRYLVLKLGNWRENYSTDKISYARFVENNTPTVLGLKVNDAKNEILVSFSSERENHYIIFDKPLSVESITFRIELVKHGTSSNDACISDISAYG